MSLRYNEHIGKKIRSDSLKDLGKHTITFVEKTIDEGKKKEAKELLQYMNAEHGDFLASVYSVMQNMETFVAENLGEEKIGEMWRYIAEKNAANRPAWASRRIPKHEDWTPLDLLISGTETERGCFTESVVFEDDEKYGRAMNVCGGCGRMRRQGEPQGVTKNAYTWSWGKKRVPFHCTHKAVLIEAMRYEHGKVPILTDWSEDSNQPCVSYYYKDPKKAVSVFRERLSKMLEEDIIEDKEEAKRLLAIKFKFNKDQFGH